MLADGSRRARRRRRSTPTCSGRVRGAGANFGIVTAFELEADEVGDVVFARMAFDARDAAGCSSAGAQLVEARAARADELPDHGLAAGRAPIAQLYSVYAGDDAAAAVDALTPLLGRRAACSTSRRSSCPTPRSSRRTAACTPAAGAPAIRAGLLDHVTPRSAAALMAAPARPATRRSMQLRPSAARSTTSTRQATAYAHRTQNFVVNAVGSAPRAAQPGVGRDWSPRTSTGSTSSFDTDPRPERLHDAFPGETLDRLRRLKASYDPRQRLQPELQHPARDGHRRRAGATEDLSAAEAVWQGSSPHERGRRGITTPRCS